MGKLANPAKSFGEFAELVDGKAGQRLALDFQGKSSVAQATTYRQPETVARSAPTPV